MRATAPRVEVWDIPLYYIDLYPAIHYHFSCVRPSLIVDILPRLKPWDSNSRKKASLIPAKSITFGRFRSAAYATAMALGI